MNTIVAIGGGEISLPETLPIDREIVSMAEKAGPRALFIPTASGEPQPYIDAFNRRYGDTLGCETDVLRLLTAQTADAEIEERILAADIVYVGGGNTRRMLEAWRARGVDALLHRAYARGVILSGLSAGSICWFEAGFSDSELDDTGHYATLPALGMLHGLHCPHYDERPEFDAYMRTHPGTGIGIDECCALVVRDGMYKTVASTADAAAYVLHGNGGILEKERINRSSYAPLPF